MYVLEKEEVGEVGVAWLAMDRWRDDTLLT